MASPPFQVFPYDISTLNRLLSDNSKAEASRISSKSHSGYFQEYFANLAARTIVAEHNYVDRDFLEDYSGYYARCLDDYNRRCLRLHVFQYPFLFEDFDNLLVADNLTQHTLASELQSSYLGFIVVKPLPVTVIGRTCLKTYSDDGGRRFFVTRDYGVNLYGLPLHVRTLAFQEQDTEAAACATSALWTAFHSTGYKFNHPILSPLEITKAANALGEHLTRSLPASGGLTTNQMVKAIRSVQLDPYYVNVQDEYLLKSTLYAYLNYSIPVILLLALVDRSDPVKHIVRGLHAVTITGFSLGLPKPIMYKNFFLKASRIDNIYAHDDQVGPFARMVFDGIQVGLDGRKSNSLSTSFPLNGVAGNMRAVPSHLIIPLYHKIRIPFSVVHDAVLTFDALIEPLIQASIAPIPAPLEWDIYLNGVNDLKTSIARGAFPAGTYRKEILLEDLPRFLWVAMGRSEGNPMLCLLFDPTDVLQGRFILRAIEYNPVLGQVLRAYSKGSPVVDQLMNAQPHAWKIFKWFASQP